MDFLIIGGLVVLAVIALFNRKPKEKTMKVRPVVPPPSATLHVKSYSMGQYYWFALLAFAVYGGLSYLTLGVSANFCDPAYETLNAFGAVAFIHAFALAGICYLILPKTFWTYGREINARVNHNPILKWGLFAGFVFSVFMHYTAVTAC